MLPRLIPRLSSAGKRDMRGGYGNLRKAQRVQWAELHSEGLRRVRLYGSRIQMKMQVAINLGIAFGGLIARGRWPGVV